MTGRALDLVGNSYGTLTPISPEIRYNKRGWICSCSCGNTRWVPTFYLTSGSVKTCGDMVHKVPVSINQKIGKLTVEKIYKNERTGRYMANCICDCGGRKDDVPVKNFQRNTTTHCGCSVSNKNRGKPEGESSRNALISSYKSNARKKGLEFSLTPSECEELFKGNCYFCGKAPDRVFTRKRLKGTYVYNGIDRKNSDLGYTLDNVDSCCTECNFLKGDRTNENFIAHIKKIIENHITD